MRLIYQGPFDGVEIPVLGDLVVKRGEPVDIPSEIAEQLLGQGDNWTKAGRKQKPAQEDD